MVCCVRSEVWRKKIDVAKITKKNTPRGTKRRLSITAKDSTLSNMSITAKDITAETFIRIGADEIISMTYSGGEMSKLLVKEWMSHFGTMPEKCHWLWIMIDPEGNKAMRSAQPIHLLWAIYFLRTYPSSESTAKSGCGNPCTSKTWRKWIHLFVDAISYLESRVVSFIF